MMPGAAMPASFACRSSSPRMACRFDCTSGRLTFATVGLIILQSGGLRPRGPPYTLSRGGPTTPLRSRGRTSPRSCAATDGLHPARPARSPPSSARVGAREVLESRVLLQEYEPHGARGSVALFADDQLGHALGLGWHLALDRIHLFAIDEHDDVGVLFQRARLTKVGQLR